MTKIVPDHNVEGHLQILISVCTSADWHGFWRESECEIETFEGLGLDRSVSDDVLWRRCQERDVVLLTGNRNAEGEDSLEVTIRREGTSRDLPIFTIGDPDEVIQNPDYAERVAARMLEYLIEIENLRGAGRLYLP